jgi:hypothetical protein
MAWSKSRCWRRGGGQQWRAQHTLAPGQQLQVLPSGRIQPGPALSSNTAAEGWLQGQLVFDATPLSIVVERMNRYGRTPLVIADPRSPTWRRHVPRGDAQELLSALELGWSVAGQTRPDARWNCAARTEEACGDGSTGRAAGGCSAPCSASRCAAALPRRCSRAGRHPGLDVGWPVAPALQQWARQRHCPAVRCA